MSEDLNRFSQELRRAEPQPASMPREQLFFEAGRASARAGVWKCLTLASLLVCVGLLTLLVLRPVRVVQTEILVSPNPLSAPTPAVEISAAQPIARLRQMEEAVLTQGLDAIEPRQPDLPGMINFSLNRGFDE
jgi:hypothetical protein